MFVSPPPPWGSTHCYGTEAAICKTVDSAWVTRKRESCCAWRAKHDVCRV